MLRRKIGALGTKDLAVSLLRTIVSAGVMGAAIFLAMGLLPEAEHRGEQILHLLGLMGVGIAVFFAMARLLKCPELEEVLTLVRRRRLRKQD